MLEQMKQPGMFSWNELITSDVKGAKQFYSKLLGWTLEDESNPNGMQYTRVKANNHEIGGIMATPKEAKGMPSMWGSYVTVDDVDAMMNRVTQLGGRIIAEPRDIPHVGRFCVIQDPQGALLTLITYLPSVN